MSYVEIDEDELKDWQDMFRLDEVPDPDDEESEEDDE